MAVKDTQWEIGSACLYTSSGSSVNLRWGVGSAFVLHEYIEDESSSSSSSNRDIWPYSESTTKIGPVSKTVSVVGPASVSISKVTL